MEDCSLQTITYCEPTARIPDYYATESLPGTGGDQKTGKTKTPASQGKLPDVTVNQHSQLQETHPRFDVFSQLKPDPVAPNASGWVQESPNRDGTLNRAVLKRS